MHRFVLALVGMTMVAGAEPTASAELAPLAAMAGLDTIYSAEVCWPLPLSYPRGWEIVIHTPCPPGYYLPRYYHRAHYGYWPSGSMHRRPYLRPGWWW
jgi:hypothetical protein